MASPYREDAAALRDRRDAIARDLDCSEAMVAKLTTERARLRLELEAIEERLGLRKPPLHADALRSKKVFVLFAVSGAPLLAVIVALAYVNPFGPAPPPANLDPNEFSLRAGFLDTAPFHSTGCFVRSSTDAGPD